jgi:NOL1/NOP2/sun family putative RNA methylase
MDTSCLEKLPEKFLEKVERVVPQELKESVYKGLQSRRPTTFRTNRLKITTAELEQKLRDLGVEFEKISWFEDGFILKSPSKRELIDLDIYSQGLLYVQSFSSMIPPLILDPQKDEKVLDLTAAPGSKTTQMAMMMENSGKIVANDRSKVRLYKLGYNLKMQGVTNTEIVYMDGMDLWKKYPEQFDRVLVDVPCSLEGRFNCSDPKSYKDWAPGKTKVLSSLQKFLLRSAVSACKVGGTIVYSTCTLSVEENEEVIDWILDKEGDAIEIEPIELTVSDAISGLTEYGNKKYDPKVAFSMRIFPSEQMEGFFVAKIKKNKSTVSGN